MALIPVISVSNTLDCGTINLVDVTGVYDPSINPGGYGTPNLTLAAVTGVVISMVYYPPGGSPSIPYPATGTVSFFPTIPNPAPFLLNESYILTPALFGLTQTVWNDGIYVFTYSVTDGVNTYTATLQYELICNALCCLDNKLVNVCFCGDCNCDDTDLLFFNWMGLQASQAAAACFKNGEALDILQCVTDFCAESDCGCNK